MKMELFMFHSSCISCGRRVGYTVTLPGPLTISKERSMEGKMDPEMEVWLWPGIVWKLLAVQSATLFLEVITNGLGNLRKPRNWQKFNLPPTDTDSIVACKTEETQKIIRNWEDSVKRKTVQQNCCWYLPQGSSRFRSNVWLSICML